MGPVVPGVPKGLMAQGVDFNKNGETVKKGLSHSDHCCPVNSLSHRERVGERG
jgi:hypothetical protein